MRIRYRNALLILALIIGVPQTAVAQVARLHPVDEAARDPSFFVFRARLLEAIERRDGAYITSIVSPNIKNSFGGNDGVEEFKKVWKLESPESRFWGTMISVLALGGSFDGPSRFYAPYTYSKFPDDIDGFEHGVIVGESVRVRKQPSPDGPVIGSLSYDIVRVVDWNLKQDAPAREGWVVVQMKDGAKGYVARQYIRSPVDYRAVFEKGDGRWVMTVLLAGD